MVLGTRRERKPVIFGPQSGDEAQEQEDKNLRVQKSAPTVVLRDVRRKRGKEGQKYPSATYVGDCESAGY